MVNPEVFQQRKFTARFEWGYKGVRTLAPVSDILVVIDVLSFTTCVDIVLGQKGIVFPYRYKDASAIDFAHEKNALLAGKRGELISLSPKSLMTIDEYVRIVLPSPNGATCSFIAKEHKCTVIAACLRNASSVAQFIGQQGSIVSIIASGERWSDGSLRPCFEDLVAAGAILSQLEGFSLSPESRYAVSVYQSCQSNLLDLLMESSSGQELITLGYEDDVKIAAEIDSSHVVPVLNEEGAFIDMCFT